MSDTWTIGELVEHAAHLLPRTPPRPNGRVRDVPNERLIRWYTTIGLLDPPLTRRGRVALYGRRHLLQLVAIKRRQADGRSIADIQAELAGATDTTLEQIAGLSVTAGLTQGDHHGDGVAGSPAARPAAAAPPAHPGDGPADPTPPAHPGDTPPAHSGDTPAPAARPRFWTARPAAVAPSPVTTPASPASAETVTPAPTIPVPADSRAPAGAHLPATGTRTSQVSPPPEIPAPAPVVPVPAVPGVEGAPAGFLAAPFGPEQALPAPPSRRAGGLPVLPVLPPADDLVHGVRLAAGVTLLLEGRPPAPGDIAALREAAAPLLASLRERDLAGPAGAAPLRSDSDPSSPESPSSPERSQS
ncbi:MerR family transcriptional regulator [Sphaerisporangium perillae]|uniref:MerR family transcriptional regulator n=1 Tax=Sphaerisporangium perillae TaxID=2935860 RepID=UPI0024359E3F|nr:MerR family transcriptional regulator [Sphaerisporangium perillae]